MPLLQSAGVLMTPQETKAAESIDRVRMRLHNAIAMLDAAKRVTGRKIAVEYGERRPGDPPALFANADKIRQELGWQARYTEIDEIVATAWNWFSKHPDGYAPS